MEVSALPEPHLRPEWPAIERILERAVTEGETFDPAIDCLWVAYERGTIFGCVTTRLETNGTAELRLVSGIRLKEWIAPMEAMLTSWARDCGAHRFVSRGRVGWGRFAKRHGWAALGLDDEGKAGFSKQLLDRGPEHR